jgi:hypothetical protein
MSPPKDQGPELLRDILGRLFAARGWGRRQGQLRLEQAWAQAIQSLGPQFAQQTQVSALRPRGVLEINVSNSALRQELVGYHKKPLLEQLRKLLPDVTVTELRFRAGKMR